MTGYTKLFSSITDSTIWREPDCTRLIWITMLAMADQHGIVSASVPGLADRARVSLDDCLKALETLKSPDEWSRTQDYEGRRIEPVDGGWILLNHGKYRAIREADERREQSRVAMAKLRAKRKPVSNVNDVSHGEPRLAQAEASSSTEANTEAKSKAKIAKPLRASPPKTTEVSMAKSTEAWKAYSDAYFERYGCEPMRDAQTNTALAKLVDKVGAIDAPHIAAFYVHHNGQFYAGQCHPASLLMKDAQKLRTEWITGRKVTNGGRPSVADINRSALQEAVERYAPK